MLAAAALGLSSVTAEAACMHTGQLFSCVDASGAATEYYCFGVGSVLTCMNFSGGWLLVAPHELLSQVTTTSMDSQLASALAADAARNPTSATPGGAAAGGTVAGGAVAGTVPNGFYGRVPPQPGVHP